MIFAAVIVALLMLFDYRVPSGASQIVEVTIISVADAPQGNGWRRIVVKMPDGSERAIETLVPFYYKPGYGAHVGIYPRIFFADIYDFVSSPSKRP